MSIDKSLLSGSTALMLLKLLEKQDMYGYQMTEELRLRSDNVFALKAGTIYPLLHSLETKGLISSYLDVAQGRERKYYSLTKDGRRQLAERETEWTRFTCAIDKVLNGGALYGTV